MFPACAAAPRHCKDALKNALKDALKNALKNALKDALNDVLNDALKNALNDVLNDALKNALKYTLKDALPGVPRTLPDADRQISGRATGSGQRNARRRTAGAASPQQYRLSRQKPRDEIS